MGHTGLSGQDCVGLSRYSRARYFPLLLRRRPVAQARGRFPATGPRDVLPLDGGGARGAATRRSTLRVRTTQMCGCALAAGAPRDRARGFRGAPWIDSTIVTRLKTEAG